jgi:hypothetical protein
MENLTSIRLLDERDQQNITGGDYGVGLVYGLAFGAGLLASPGLFAAAFVVGGGMVTYQMIF